MKKEINEFVFIDHGEKMIKKAVIPAAGFGTRLLPATKEQPKEMLPVFSRGANGKINLKPIVQVIYENIFNSGVRNFCFIVGRTKRAIEDHFTPDSFYLEQLKNKNKELFKELKHFYEMLDKSKILWINQSRPKGFGDAVFMAKDFIGSEDFLVHAGDAMVLSKKTILEELYNLHKKYNSDATIMAERVEDPKKYGVILGEEIENKIHKVLEISEKPVQPKSNLIVIAVYIFKPIIFDVLKQVKPDKNNEKQLTDAIQILIDQGSKVHALELDKGEKHLDIGNVERYRKALKEIV